MRPPRLVVPGCAHHVTQRGVRKGPTFYDDSDHLVYIRLAKEAFANHSVKICSYCLMNNHVHLVAIPDSEKGLSNALRDAHTAYTLYFNAKHGFVGHAWQGRPKIFVMDDVHFCNAVRYVERNPVRAGIVIRAEDYPWSSAAAHCGLRDDLLLSTPIPWAEQVANWSEWLSCEEAPEELKRMRAHIAMDKPLGSLEFLAKLEVRVGRKLLPQKRGRPGNRVMQNPQLIK
jgi:putative transposase